MTGRTVERQRTETRTLFGFREATVADAEALEAWFTGQVATVGTDPDHLVVLLEGRCREILIEPPSADRVDRIIRAAISAHDERFCAGIRDRLAELSQDRAHGTGSRPASFGRPWASV